MNVYDKLQELNLTLPEAPAKGGLYSPYIKFANNLVYISGCGPVIGGDKACGKLGTDYTTEEGMDWARNSMLNVLAVLESCVGDLNKVSKAVKILVFVACDDEFTEQPLVANGGSALLLELFGAKNLPTRSAVGVNVLPGNIPVEIEAIFELKSEET